MSIATEYTLYWKNIGSVLLYQHPGFQFYPTVILTEFENCLIDKLSNAKLYHNIDPKNITLYDDTYFKKLQHASSSNISIILLCNTDNNSKLLIDTIKQKIESFVEIYKLPILAFFSLKSNRFSKPHTGMWQLLNGYYQTKGYAKISKACYISDNGGRIIEIEKKNGKQHIITDKSDTDRAFAHNIDIPFLTISEYLGKKKEKFIWNNKCLSPEQRIMYIEKLSTYKNPDIFAHMSKKGPSDQYMIMIFGPPCSGKTTVAKELIKRWDDSAYGKTHAMKRLDLNDYSKSSRVRNTKKLLEDNISVIIDGECHTSMLREPFELIAKELHTPILYVEINPSIPIAYLFNHVLIETSQNERQELYPDKNYYIYKSIATKPKDTISYCPVIKYSDELMKYRY